MTDLLDYTRHLPLPGTHNFRDVGGYETAGGGHIRWRTLFRSDSLHRLDANAQQEIVSLGVRTIVDLRHLRETEQLPNAFATSRDVRYLNAPIVAFPAPKRLAESLEELNRIWLEHCQDPISGVFARLGEPDAFPSVVHCAIGKDRTGLIIALLLRLAGVPAETVVEDYALSGLYAAPAIAAFRDHVLLNGGDAAKLMPMLECRAEVMEVTLEHLDAAYGGVHDYVARIGVPEPVLEGIRARLVEQPTPL